MTTRIRSLDGSTSFLLTSLTLLVTSVGALAQAPDPAGQAGSLYARVRHLEGPVVVVGADGERSGEHLGVNAPILPADSITTHEGRLEVQLADGSLLRLDRRTELEARVLSDLSNQFEDRTWLLLGSGSAYLYVEGLEGSDPVFRLDTPTASIYFLTQGIFRIDVDPAGRGTTISSQSGVAEVVSQGISVLVRSGDRADVRPHQRPSDTRPFNPYDQDSFDRWNRDRQAAYVKVYETLPATEVPPEIRPYVTELAYYGDWVQEPAYGWVWRPPLAGADWSPYRGGRWHYAPAGWIWVSYEPWGWAPYHYGRWEYHAALGWIWIPGRVFSGAWVSWAWGPGYLGWCPLNYYNRPVVRVRLHARHPHRSWVFVPQDQVHRVRLQRVAVPRLRLESVNLTPIDGAPRVRPRQLASRSLQAPPAGTRTVASPREDGDRVSFRTLEGRGRIRKEPAAARAVPSGAPRSRAVDFRPGTAPRRPSSPGPASRDDRWGDLPAGRTATPSRTDERPRIDREPARGRNDRGTVRPAEPPAARPNEPTRGVRIIQPDEKPDLLQKIFRKEPATRRPPVAPKSRDADVKRQSTDGDAKNKGTSKSSSKSSGSARKAKPKSAKKKDDRR